MPGVTQIPPGALPPVDPDPAPTALRVGSVITESQDAGLMRAIREAQALPGLVALVRDLAAWSETVAADSCDTGVLADLEELGRRAHELVRAMDGEGLS